MSQKENITANWEGFNKYFGVQGIMALMLVAAFIWMTVNTLPIPDLFNIIMATILGFYFAKNGVGIVAALNTKNGIK